jgi:hypothetical protein
MKMILAAMCILVAATQALRAEKLPRAYVGLLSTGAATGYHGWTHTTHPGPSFAAWDVNLSAIEGLYFPTPRFGLGVRLVDLTLCPEDSFLSANMFAMAMPMIGWVTNSGARGFGYLNFEIMPYMPDNTGESQMISSAFALDYSYVPFAPWPLEARARAGAMVFSWTGERQIGYQLAVGIRVGLGYWFTRERP